MSTPSLFEPLTFRRGPAMANRLALSPLGLVTVEARAGCLFIGTFHTFPDEHTVVKTQSLIEKK